MVDGVTNFTDISTEGMGVVKGGSHTVVASEASAVGSMDIDTGLTSITGYIVQIYRSGVQLNLDQAVSVTGGTITVADGASTYEVAIGDIVNWFAWGS